MILTQWELAHVIFNNSMQVLHFFGPGEESNSSLLYMYANVLCFKVYIMPSSA